MARLSKFIATMLAAAVFGAMPVAGAQAVTVTAKANVKVLKPLAFKSIQDLEFGQIVLGGTGTKTVSVSSTGVLTCAAGLTCSGVTRQAIFNVAGSNGEVVRIFAASSDLVNATDGTTMRFTPTAPASVTLINSGAPGLNFNVGGSIAIPSTAIDGVYSGVMDVTVDYQ
jgi:Mat/Ecp fimbriae major subunit